jgi:septal ring factor EnvC (AmiA/AmiB activator)
VLTSEERLAHLEGRIVEHGQTFTMFDNRLAGFDQKFAAMDQRLTGMDARLSGVEQRLSGVEQRLSGVEQRLGAVEQRLDVVEQRLGAVEQRLSRAIRDAVEQVTARIQACDLEVGVVRRDMLTQFRWTTGMFLTGFVAILAAVMTR